MTSGTWIGDVSLVFDNWITSVSAHDTSIKLGLFKSGPTQSSTEVCLCKKQSVCVCFCVYVWPKHAVHVSAAPQLAVICWTVNVCLRWILQLIQGCILADKWNQHMQGGKVRGRSEEGSWNMDKLKSNHFIVCHHGPHGHGLLLDAN